MAKRILRPKEAMRCLGVGHTKFYEDFVNTGRLPRLRLGPKAVGFTEDDVDRLIDELRDAAA